MHRILLVPLVIQHPALIIQHPACVVQFLADIEHLHRPGFDVIYDHRVLCRDQLHRVLHHLRLHRYRPSHRLYSDHDHHLLLVLSRPHGILHVVPRLLCRHGHDHGLSADGALCELHGVQARVCQ